MKIHTQDNRGDWIARRSCVPWHQPLMVKHWRPSFWWRITHTARAILRRA